VETIGTLLDIPGYFFGAWMLLCGVCILIVTIIRIVRGCWWAWKYRVGRKARRLHCVKVSEGPTDEWRRAIEKAGQL